MTMPRMNAPHMAVAALRLIAKNATPGDWDAIGGHVAVVRSPDPGSLDTRMDPESLAYYGGYLICESCDQADALFIAAAKTLLPDVLDAYEQLAFQVGRLQQRLRLAESDVSDLRETLDFERSRRYVAPLRPLERAGVVLITRHNAVLVAQAVEESDPAAVTHTGDDFAHDLPGYIDAAFV